jgi:hypothetical protein
MGRYGGFFYFDIELFVVVVKDGVVVALPPYQVHLLVNREQLVVRSCLHSLRLNLVKGNELGNPLNRSLNDVRELLNFLEVGCLSLLKLLNKKEKAFLQLFYCLPPFEHFLFELLVLHCDFQNLLVLA